MTPADRLSIYLVGFNDGFKHALTLYRQLAAGAPPAEASAPADQPPPVAARRDAPPSTNGAEPPEARRAERRRRKSALTPGEEFALLAVTENPGLSAMELRRRCGVKSVGPIYALVRRRKIRRVEDPKPHTPNRPWVRFYPMEPTNG